MKTDLTHLSLEDQIAAVVALLRRLHESRAKDAPDLHRYFKHRAFKTTAQRTWHYTNLLTAALLALNGREADFKRVFTAMSEAVIYEPGDRVLHDGLEWVVRDTLPEGKLLVKRGEGTRTVLAKHCSPAPAPILVASVDNTR